MLNFRNIFGRLTLRERLEIDLHEAICEKEECDHFGNMLTERINRLTTALARGQEAKPASVESAQAQSHN